MALPWCSAYSINIPLDPQLKEKVIGYHMYIVPKIWNIHNLQTSWHSMDSMDSRCVIVFFYWYIKCFQFVPVLWAINWCYKTGGPKNPSDNFHDHHLDCIRGQNKKLVADAKPADFSTTWKPAAHRCNTLTSKIQKHPTLVTLCSICQIMFREKNCSNTLVLYSSSSWNVKIYSQKQPLGQRISDLPMNLCILYCVYLYFSIWHMTDLHGFDDLTWRWTTKKLPLQGRQKNTKLPHVGPGEDDATHQVARAGEQASHLGTNFGPLRKDCPNEITSGRHIIKEKTWKKPVLMQWSSEYGLIFRAGRSFNATFFHISNI